MDLRDKRLAEGAEKGVFFRVRGNGWHGDGRMVAGQGG